MKRFTCIRFFQLDEEGKLKFDKILEVMKEIIAIDDDFQVVENIVKSCSLG